MKCCSILVFIVLSAAAVVAASDAFPKATKRTGAPQKTSVSGFCRAIYLDPGSSAVVDCADRMVTVHCEAPEPTAAPVPTPEPTRSSDPSSSPTPEPCSGDGCPGVPELKAQADTTVEIDDRTFIFAFTNSKNLSVPEGSSFCNAEVLLVGGGGGGGFLDGGGGGAGGVYHFGLSSPLPPGAYGLNVAKGGKGGIFTGTRRGADGGTSSFAFPNGTTIEAGGGGGGGGAPRRRGRDGTIGTESGGGSGGGAGQGGTGSSAVGGKAAEGGNDGGLTTQYGAGGGGKGSEGKNSTCDDGCCTLACNRGDGGDGIAIPSPFNRTQDIFGVDIAYIAGGGGGGWEEVPPVPGGSGVGGNGGYGESSNPVPCTEGAVSTGSGGGGGGAIDGANRDGCDGADGIILLYVEVCDGV